MNNDVPKNDVKNRDNSGTANVINRESSQENESSKSKTSVKKRNPNENEIAGDSKDLKLPVKKKKF